MTRHTVGSRIQEARLANPRYRRDQEALARDVGVSRQTVSNWENDKAMPTAANVRALSECLGVTPGWISDGGAGAGGRVMEGGPAYGKALRSTPMLEMLDRGSGVRRFDGHLGAGSRIAMANAEADARGWNREELREALQYAEKWAIEQEEALNRLYREKRRRDRGDDDEGGP